MTATGYIILNKDGKPVCGSLGQILLYTTRERAEAAVIRAKLVDVKIVSTVRGR